MAKSVNRSISLWINGKEIQNNIKSIRAEMFKLISEQNKMTIGSEEYNQKAAAIKQLKTIYAEHKHSLRITNDEIEKANNLWGEKVVRWAAFASFAKNIGDIYGKITAKLSEFTSEFAKLDDVFADVIKYTGLTRNEINQLNEEFKKIDTRTSREQLNMLAAEAGKLGISGVKNIKDFVEAADIINIALGKDLGDGAVKSMGKLVDMFQIENDYSLKEGMIKIASTINQVGQSSTASEAYLLNLY
ncbi:MAG: hypothetical protein PHU62_10035 [Bacteroidales bacterium]|nr:hypothetical protein [Bacteroidales bacterium]MDD2205665.1 hypothetical protein [Bacteroidales bacterium]MDD3152421.1 hypothetical protein [Bacteroidales bacterium]MDD3915115.1 hypothetical protein [Bacteroidales bacterium]MDD4634889.1 hypothetical protein [Bacteroidales bacterium]